MIKRGKGNIFEGIFINYRGLHSNYQYYKFKRTETIFKEKHIGDDDFSQLGWVRSKNLKMVHCFLGAKQVSHSTEESGVSAALEKFDRVIRMKGFDKCSQK